MPRSHRLLALLLSTAATLGAVAPAASLAKSAHGAAHRHKAHHRSAASQPKATGATGATGAPTPVPAVCPNAQGPASGTSPVLLRAAVVCLVNQQRVDRGLPALKENPLLDTSAQAWTDSMVLTGVFSHGTNFEQRLSAVGYDWSNAGENIATGYETPDTVLAAWMASPDHCTNILNPNYADIGVGVNPAPVGTGVADAATWTQDFGLTMTAPVPSTNTGPMDGCPYA